MVNTEEIANRAQFGIQYLEVAPEVKRYPTKTTFPKKCCVSFESTFREVHRQLYFLSQSRPTASWEGASIQKLLRYLI